MNKKYIILLIILALIILVIKVTFESIDYVFPFNTFGGEEGKDDPLEINIINSERNIETITAADLNTNQGKTIKLEDIIEEKIEKALVMGRLGEIEYIENGYFQVKDKSINYVDKDKGKKIEGVKGIIINPPLKSIMDSYYDISGYLEEENVLFLLLDGFGYHQYEYAIENGYLPFLEKQPEAIKALSVYKPVTNAGLAAIITGKPPIENGVYSRKQRELKVDSIFSLAKELNKKFIYIEGDIGILKTEIEPELNMDSNGDGFTDDEVFISTLDAIDKDYNLIFAHFHGIDDSGHSFGDLSSETMEFIAIIDGYVEELATNWDGKVIITSDHGMHTTEDGGDHGQFRYTDMIVPYITFTGGNLFE